MNKVENSDFLKDTKTGVIVNSNQTDYNHARSRFAKQQSKDKKIVDLQKQVTDLENSIKQILTLLKSKN